MFLHISLILFFLHKFTSAVLRVQAVWWASPSDSWALDSVF